MKRTCGWTRERMTRLSDGELPPAELREVEAHLRTCADCREEIERSRAMRALWRPVAAIRSEAADRAAILAAAAPHLDRRRERPGWAAWAASVRPGDWLTVGGLATAAVLAVLLAGERRSLQIYEGWPPSSVVLTPAEVEAREQGARIEVRESLSIVDPLGSGSRESGIGRSS